MEEQTDQFRTRRGHWDMSDRRGRGSRRGGRFRSDRGQRGSFRGRLGPASPPRDEFSQLREEYRQAILEYRTQECPQDCREEYCDLCHSALGQSLRRKPERLKAGVWNYLPVACLQRCSDPLCAFAHTEEEVLYHPLRYKTQACDFALDGNDCCTKYGYHCPFFHAEQDREPQLGLSFNLLKPTVMMPRLDTVKLQSDYNARQQVEDSFRPEPKPTPKPKVETRPAEFQRERYKVDMCDNLSCEDPYCLCYHNADERRRGNDSLYSFTQCPNTYIESARAFKDPAKCARGEECPYAHTINEVFYHKDYYQSVPCGKATCRERYCPFSHETVSANRPVELPSAPAPVSISKSENDLQMSLLDRMCKVNSDIGGLKIQIEEATEQLKRMEEQLACVHCGKPQQQYAFYCGHAFCLVCVEGNIKQKTYICRKCNKPSTGIIEMKYI